MSCLIKDNVQGEKHSGRCAVAEPKLPSFRKPSKLKTVLVIIFGKVNTVLLILLSRLKTVLATLQCKMKTMWWFWSEWNSTGDPWVDWGQYWWFFWADWTVMLMLLGRSKTVQITTEYYTMHMVAIEQNKQSTHDYCTDYRLETVQFTIKQTGTNVGDSHLTDWGQL